MKTISKNKRAYFDYEFAKFYTAGIILKGHEVKAIKTGHVNLTDSLARIEGREIWLHNLDIPLYKKTSNQIIKDYDPKHKRKLLLNRKEITRIITDLDRPGNVIVAVEIFINNKGLIKIKLGIGKLKRKIEKKQIIKERDIKKQMGREIKRLGL